MKRICLTETLESSGEYDVIVAGGGLSGVAAALAAARAGRSVMLIEKQCSLGGLATTGLVNFWVPLCNGRGKWIIRGMAEEFLRLSISRGFDSLPPAWKNGEPAQPTEERCISSFSSGLFSLDLLRLLRQAGVTILYDALISQPVMEKNHCAGLVIDGKSGRKFYQARMLVDATGDAQLMCQAGMPTVDGDNYFTYYGEGITLEGCKMAVEKHNLLYAYSHPFGGPSDLYGRGQPEGKAPYHGVSMETINRYLQENQLLMLEKEEKKDRWERNIHMLPGMPQLRTSRRLDGNATLTEADCYRHHPTSIGAICDFERRDALYEVPYGALVKSGFDNMITCGRSASASGWGWDVLRVIPPAVLTGQAAGIAAALALETACPIADVPVPRLQAQLQASGVMIHFDDSLIPAGKAPETAPLEGHL